MDERERIEADDDDYREGLTSEGAHGRAVDAADDARLLRRQSEALHEQAGSDRDGGTYQRSVADALAERSRTAASEAQAWAAVGLLAVERERLGFEAGL